ncbi:protein disulfide-isomerase precursor [Blastocladiella emersonii ATCC 22665]|nr:protein disulfide-isomerase precursor [Blastocladiella emersonii ATCC 22665]
MKITHFIAAIGTVLAAAAVSGARADAASAADEISDVLTLTTANFDTTVKPEPLMLVEFYAPWCGHCKALAPEYEKAATALKADDIKLAKVDCTAHADVCNKFDVQGYPTMKVFRNGEPANYAGGRKEDNIVTYMRKQALPSLSVLAAKDIPAFAKKDKVVIIAHVASKDAPEYEVVAKLANQMRDDYVFGISTDKAAAAELGVKAAPALVMYRSFDEPTAEFKGVFDADELTAFIKREAVPTMDEVAPDNYMSYVESGLPLAFFFYDNAEDRKTLGPQIEAVARDVKGKINFVYCNANNFGGHADTLNLKQEWPAFAINEVEAGLKWPLDQTKPLTGAAVRDLVTKYLAKEVEPSLKSAAIPKDNNGPVTVLVGKNFKDIVLDTDKDVLVEFYAPWCGHCRKLEPTYNKIGEALAESKDKIVIAKMDATENDVPPAAGTRIEGFPTLKLFKAKDNTIVEYNGDRSYEDLLKFLQKNAANEFEVPATEEDATEAKDAADEENGSAHSEL